MIAHAFQRPQRRRLLYLVGGFIALFACLLLLGAIADDVHAQEAIMLDTLATPLLHALANPTLDAIMRAFTALGSATIVVPLFVVAVVLLLRRRHRREALFLAVSLGGSLALNQGMKLIFHRPRPQLVWAQVQPEYSFPSGHAMNSLVFFIALAAIAWAIWGRRAGSIAVPLALILALMIGTSRIYLGYHYLTDVVGGYLAGTAWLLIVGAAFGARTWPRGSWSAPSGPRRRSRAR